MDNQIKEPWKVSNVFSYLIHAKGIGTIDCHKNEVAQQIVSCVNACAGIDYPEKFIPSMRQEMQDIRTAVNADANEATIDEVNRLVSQRKMLLHQLKRLLHMHSCEQEGLIMPTGAEWFQAVNEAAEVAFKIEPAQYNPNE